MLGDLSLKDAYSFKEGTHSDPAWANIIWSNDIPPSNSTFVWSLMYDKIHTEIMLFSRAISLA